MVLKKTYQNKIVPEFKKKFGLKNDLSVPRITKVTVNVGVGRLSVAKNDDMLKIIREDLRKITGQEPTVVAAKKSIASFKLRQGMQAGFKVTLRGNRMYDFLEKLAFIVLPRTRDFKGIGDKAVDKMGNLNIGIKEHIVFPEIISESVKSIFGLQVIITTNAKSREIGKELFMALGFPIKK